MYKRPKISIIVPVYNVEPYLETCLRSVAGQTLKEIEVIVVNDGSTDNSARIIEQFKKRYSHFICLEQANQGVSKARQNGLAHSEGETVLFLDADDFIPSSYCERLYQALQRTDADMAVGPIVRYYTQTRQAVPEDMGVFSRWFLEGEDKKLLFTNFPAVMGLCGKLIKRDLLERVQLAFSPYLCGEDICPSIQLIANAKKIVPVKEAVYFYRQGREGSQTNSGTERFSGLFKGFLDARNYLLQSGQYTVYAEGFEYVRLVCLCSFMEMYDLSETDEKLLQEYRPTLLLPARLFKKRSLRFRARVKLLKWCLRTGFSYARCMQQVRRSRRWLFKEK